jgi:ribosomal protein S18 acetylase RimI-like enzyme
VVANTARRCSSADGLRPLNLVHDWRQVLQLIEVAFGEDLDAEARRALHSMRLPGLLAPLAAVLDNLSPPGEGMMPGFVWLQGGHVVGTASVRRVHALSRGWLISNVAVHPDWQGQGIGRALLEAALDFAQVHGGAWVVLQARDSNRVARRLYESLGFEVIGRVDRLRLATLAEARVGPEATSTGRLRAAGWLDGIALLQLARALTPHDVFWADTLNRDLYRTGLLDHLVGRLQGYRRRWWVVNEPERAFRAAVGVEVDARNDWHRLRLLVLPEAQDEGLASDLIAFGLAQLAGARPLPVEIEQPESAQAVQAALAGAGFEPLYALVHMRLNFK